MTEVLFADMVAAITLRLLMFLALSVLLIIVCEVLETEPYAVIITVCVIVAACYVIKFAAEYMGIVT